MTLLRSGDVAPSFELPDQDGKLWRLSDLRGKRVILYFYPADDTPGCTIEACDFRDALEELSRAGYVVLGISPQDEHSHRDFAGKYRLNFPLLVDRDLAVAGEYGAVSEDKKLFRGIPLEVSRCTFMIDEKGVIQDAYYGVKAKGHVDALRTGFKN